MHTLLQPQCPENSFSTRQANGSMHWQSYRSYLHLVMAAMVPSPQCVTLRLAPEFPCPTLAAASAHPLVLTKPISMPVTPLLTPMPFSLVLLPLGQTRRPFGLLALPIRLHVLVAILCILAPSSPHLCSVVIVLCIKVCSLHRWYVMLHIQPCPANPPTLCCTVLCKVASATKQLVTVRNIVEESAPAPGHRLGRPRLLGGWHLVLIPHLQAPPLCCCQLCHQDQC